MRHLSYSCQFLIWGFFLGLFVGVWQGCAPLAPKREKAPVKNPPPPKRPSVQSHWFDVPERFAARTREGKQRTHTFFDFAPGRKGKMLNYILLTPVGSEFGYSFDLVSGKKYKKFHYCKQKDVWEKYQDPIERPPFSEGFIPRLLDQSGRPGRLWVFGDSRYLKGEKGKQSMVAQKARILGGLILQYCDLYPCRLENPWKGKLVLIAVNPLDPAMKKLHTLAQLKRQVDWAYVKAFAQNGFGKSVTKLTSRPAYRVTGEIEGKRAIQYAFKKGLLFQAPEMAKLKENCFYLYDYIWKSVERIKTATPKRNILQKWPAFFYYFYKKYRERFQTCQKFTPPSDILHNDQRHWFFVYLANFMNLEKLGYYYNCVTGIWTEKLPANSQKVRYPFLEGIKYCTTEKLNLAFSSSMGMMAKLAYSHRKHFRYITYDSGIGGSGERIYNWIFSNGKKLDRSSPSCPQHKVTPFFPTDISWDPLEFKSGQ